MAKDTDGKGDGGDVQKDTDGRGAGRSRLPPTAEDIFARASELGGLLVVAFISPVGGGGSPRNTPRPKLTSLARLSELADSRDRLDARQTKDVIKQQAQTISALGTKVSALTAQVAAAGGPPTPSKK